MGMDLELSTDRAAIVVPPVGRLVETDEEWEPYRLVDGEGSAVAAVAAWFSELQAAGRSVATLRSYGMDLLRWSRFLWAVGVPWDRATRAEARDFSRWLQLGGAPKRPHWRHPEGPSATRPNRPLRFCAAARGIYSPVRCWAMGYPDVCLRHRHWTGPYGAERRGAN